MKTILKSIGIVLPLLFSFTACGPIGEKSASMIIIYGVTAVLSLLLLIGYCCLVQKKNLWYLLLYSCVFIINAGYFCLGSSQTLAEALLANRISYLGSVFLPLSMLMIILGQTHFRISKWLTGILFGVSAVVFLIAASPPYLDIYYSAVSLETINGVSVLQKVYGPWHCIYLYYLMLYFGAMVAVILHARFSRKMTSTLHAVMLVMVVFVNIGIWLIEQLVQLDFEMLSVSYIFSELFLLGMYLMMQEQTQSEAERAAELSMISEKMNQPEESVDSAESSEIAEVNHLEEQSVSKETLEQPSAEPIPAVQQIADETEQIRLFCENLSKLTPTERMIYDLYLAGRSTKEVLAEMNIKENTLKYHNKNIYSKLGVSSRRELVRIAGMLQVKTRHIY